MRTRLTWFIAGALSVALAVFLNPSPERHRASIKAQIAERSQLAAVAAGTRDTQRKR